MIGTTVGHYRIVEELGGGGMGVVYRAEDTHLGRDVALKFLPPELTRDAEARERFTLEARAASALDHANICTIHDIDETDDGQLFIAMAFYDGETLKARLGRGPLEIDEAIDIARQIASGLERAHESGIVHRDIKPANVMITRHGEARIVDFGIAKLAGAARLTRTGSTLGTLGYMSPEQAEGGEVGPRADLWALGVVLYEMLVGALPFRGGTDAETVAAILAKPASAPGESIDGVDPALDDLVLDLLQKDPSERPVTAGLAAARLEAIGRPEVPPLAPLLRRATTWVGVAATVVVVAVALIVPALNRARVDAARASLAEIEALAVEHRYLRAYRLAVDAEQVLGSDSALLQLFPLVSDVVTLTSEPTGAEVWIQTIEDGPGVPVEEASLESAARSLGATPITALRIPRGSHRLTFALDGFETVERVASSTLPRRDPTAQLGAFEIIESVRLFPSGELPDDMVFVPAGEYSLVSADAPVGVEVGLDDFLIDRFEVTNADYREFVRDGGYANEGLWQGADVSGFVDRTGLAGPRGWTSQQFQESESRHPVTGVSRYEARAYCAWRGKSLPTLFEWEKAARGGAYTHTEGYVLPWGLVEPGQSTEHRANFGGTSTTAVDAHPWGISPYGAYAMAGNVREWTENPTEDGYIAMGGSWRELSYVFSSIATPEASFTSPSLGFRCVERDAEPEAQGGGLIELTRISPSYQPVDEATFRSFLPYYRYDPVELDAEIIETVETEDWVRHKISFDGLGEDRILAYLYLPVTSEPPYQTMVFVPSSSAFFVDRVSVQTEFTLGPNIRAGRAVFAVVLEGMVERGPPVLPESQTVEFRNLMVRHSTELSLGLDYLETRGDIDFDRLAYVGLSWGSGSRSVLAAIDDRFDATIFIGGGIDERVHPTLPEALNVNFLPYIDGPKLLVNGRQDEEHPWLTRAKPMYDLWSEPKDFVLPDAEGHHPSPEVLVPAINGFLDRTFGPIR